MLNIRAQRLIYFLEFVEAEVGSFAAGDAALAELGLTRNQLYSANFSVTPKQEARCVYLVCAFLDDTSMAMRAGLAFRDTFTLTSYIAKYSQNLREAIENSSKYFSLVDPSLSIGLRVSSNSASFEMECLDPSLGHRFRFFEFLMFSALGRMRTVTQTGFFPLEMRFKHDSKDVATVASRLAGFPVVFGAESYEMIVSRASLEMPIPTYDPNLREHLTEYGNQLQQAGQVKTLGLRDKIEGILSSNLPGRIVPAEEVAANLGMSRRTFARRLKEKDLSFREIVDGLRCDLARTYLKDGFSIAEISFYLDYSDQAAFSTAFKRWTGLSPSEFRGKAGETTGG